MNELIITKFVLVLVLDRTQKRLRRRLLLVCGFILWGLDVCLRICSFIVQDGILRSNLRNLDLI